MATTALVSVSIEKNDTHGSFHFGNEYVTSCRSINKLFVSLFFLIVLAELIIFYFIEIM